jgi:hypothetical protein
MSLLQLSVSDVRVYVFRHLGSKDRLSYLEVLLLKLASNDSCVLVSGLVGHHHIVHSLDLRQLLLHKSALHRQLIIRTLLLGYLNAIWILELQHVLARWTRWDLLQLLGKELPLLVRFYGALQLHQVVFG